MSRLPTLLFSVESPFSERDWVRFGIDELSRHFRVIIVDFSPISRPSLATSRERDRMVSEIILQIADVDEIGVIFSAIKPAVLLNNVGVGSIRYRLFDLANKSNTITAEFQLGAIPSSSHHSSLTETALQRLRQLPSLANLPRALLQKRMNQRWSNCLPDIFFRGGLQARGRHPLLGVSIVDVHSLDYETSIRFAANSRRSNRLRIVYLDQDIGYHSDVPGLGLRHPVTPEHFYPRINHYFDWLEQEHDCRVVVSPHPRTTTAHTERRFPRKYVSTEVTAFEISQCSAVMGHVSTSFSFAVISRIPATILTSSEIRRSWYAPYTERFASELLAPLVNLDEPTSWVSPAITLTQDQHDAYDLYELNYLKSYSGPARDLWTMIGDELLQRVNG